MDRQASPSVRPSARPWSTTGLARRGISRSDLGQADAHLSEEWANLQEAPLSWIDLESDSAIEALRQGARNLEAKALGFARDALRVPQACASVVAMSVSSAIKGISRRP